ncbi:LuxR C-terminal-related transcriptional regulator [Nitrospira sp. BLG_2]|uniref:LuxR C-terminal-related transcriptional regulator n=1 Tax=Nitrospira sp. BLG_2 TaxID=3397507 RepID=UPI003B9BE783
MMPCRDIRIAIVHRDGLYRDCLRHSLAQTQLLSIVHSADGLGQETWQAVVACRPDLLIIDFGLCRRQERAYPNERVDASSLGMKTIVVGVPNSEDDILACIEGEGAAGYLLIDSSLDDLISNIRAVMNGETLCSPRVASLAFDRVSALTRQIESRQVGERARLTKRETEIVRLIDKGLTNKEIAVHLHIEVSTVKNHVHNILDKLHLRNRYSAVKHIKSHASLTGRC